MDIVGIRLITKLNAISYLSLELTPPPKKLPVYLVLFPILLLPGSCAEVMI